MYIIMYLNIILNIFFYSCTSMPQIIITIILYIPIKFLFYFFHKLTLIKLLVITYRASTFFSSISAAVGNK